MHRGRQGCSTFHLGPPPRKTMQSRDMSRRLVLVLSTAAQQQPRVEINLWPSIKEAADSQAMHFIFFVMHTLYIALCYAASDLADWPAFWSQPPLSPLTTPGAPEAGVCACHWPSPRHAIDDSYSLMKLYSSFLSRAALTRWTLTIHPLSGTHLFPLLLRVLTSHLLPERLLSWLPQRYGCCLVKTKEKRDP